MRSENFLNANEPAAGTNGRNGHNQEPEPINGDGQTHGKKWSWVYKEYRNLSWLIDDLDLTLAENRIATHLLRRGMDEGEAWSFKETIANDTGIHRNTVAIIVKDLAAKRIIRIEHKRRKPRQRERDVYVWLRPEAWAIGIFRVGSKGAKWQLSLERVQPESAYECNLRVHPNGSSATSECTIEEASNIEEATIEEAASADEASASLFSIDSLEETVSPVTTPKSVTSPKEDRTSKGRSRSDSKTPLKGPPAPRANQPKPFSPPTQHDFVAFAESKGIDRASAALLFERWSGADWIDGNNHAIKNWKWKLITFKQKGWIPTPQAGAGSNGNNGHNGHSHNGHSKDYHCETPEEKQARWAREEASGNGDSPFTTN
jgi:hypothetical protein